MIHDGQRLPLRLEALNDGLVVLSGLDQLQGHCPPYRPSLFGQPHLAHAPLTQASRQAIRANRYRFCVNGAAERRDAQTPLSYSPSHRGRGWRKRHCRLGFGAEPHSVRRPIFLVHVAPRVRVGYAQKFTMAGTRLNSKTRQGLNSPMTVRAPVHSLTSGLARLRFRQLPCHHNCGCLTFRDFRKVGTTDEGNLKTFPNWTTDLKKSTALCDLLRLRTPPTRSAQFCQQRK